jgi:hypothetical protein
MQIGRKIIQISLFCFLTVPVLAQLRDTSLLTLYSKPFFFNVIKGGDGRIYTGTSEGILRMDGSKMEKFDNRIGYLTLGQKGEPVIDSNGIKYHDQKTFIDLLPYPEESRVEFHAGTEDHFYITAGGRMHIYEILPYAYKYRNHSVRSVSRNFVGTYSGIYYLGNKQKGFFPGFVDGRIREYNGKAFICYSALLIADIPSGEGMPMNVREGPKGFDYSYITDLVYSDRLSKYFMATKTSIGSMDKDLTRAETLYQAGDKDGEVVMLGEDRSAVIFASGNKLMAYKPLDGNTSTFGILPEQIMDGHLSALNYFLLGRRGLYVRRADGTTNKLIDLNKAHSLAMINNSELVIATDAGLYLYDLTTKKLSALIKGVEFNRWGLFLDQDKLHACSINGMYILNAKELGLLAEQVEKKAIQGQRLPNFVVALIVGSLALSILLGFLLFSSRRRLNRIIEEKAASELPNPTREDIENYIRENLPVASLKSIIDHFNTKTSTIYTLLDPEKPGAFIQRLRMEKVAELRKEKISAREIAAITGFSESYVRKIWNPKEQG